MLFSKLFLWSVSLSFIFSIAGVDPLLLAHGITIEDMTASFSNKLIQSKESAGNCLCLDSESSPLTKPCDFADKCQVFSLLADGQLKAIENDDLCLSVADAESGELVGDECRPMEKDIQADSFIWFLVGDSLVSKLGFQALSIKSDAVVEVESRDESEESQQLLFLSEPEKAESTNLPLILAISGGSFVLLTVFAAIAIVYYFHRKKQKMLKELYLNGVSNK